MSSFHVGSNEDTIGYIGVRTGEHEDPAPGRLVACILQESPEAEPMLHFHCKHPSQPMGDTRLLQLPMVRNGTADTLPATDRFLRADGTWKPLATAAGGSGPQGPPGPEGPMGPQGLQGPAGPISLPGIAGTSTSIGPIATTELTVIKIVLDAEAPTVGSIYRIVMSGTISNAASAGTVSARARIGAGIMTDPMAANVTYGTRGGMASAVPFRATLDVVFTVVGTTGALIGSGEISAVNLTFTGNVSGVTVPAGVNTTLSRTLQGTIICTGTGVSVTIYAAYIERVR